jgi:hypothetical protein
MIEVELFPKVNDRNRHSTQPLGKLLQWATSNETQKQNTNTYKNFLIDNPNATKKEISEMKIKYFPAITFAGTFGGTGKSEELIKMSGLIVLDFDHVERLEEVRQELENDITTFLLFVSPSGDGLKLIIKHDLKDPLKWQYLFQELEEYFANKYYLVTDKSGKDISRMCYIPFIDKLYQNDDCWVWNYRGEFEPKKDNESNSKQYEQTEITDELSKECYYISEYLKENNINIAEYYDDWVSYAYSLCCLGENGRICFHNISSVSDKYDYDENEKQYDYCFNNFDDCRTGIGHYLTNAKKAMANYILYEEFDFLCDK